MKGAAVRGLIRREEGKRHEGEEAKRGYGAGRNPFGFLVELRGFEPLAS